jgi:hypothetical protein
MTRSAARPGRVLPTMTSSFDIAALQGAAAAFHAEVGAELSRLVAPLTPRDREHFRGALAEIIAGRGACPPDHC